MINSYIEQSSSNLEFQQLFSQKPAAERTLEDLKVFLSFYHQNSYLTKI